MSAREEVGSSTEHDALRVSVVIATYARPVALKRAVESLYRQTRLPEEIVIVVWSGDGPTIRAVSDLMSQKSSDRGDVRITAVHTNAHTVTVNENEGMAAAAGNIVCFMDDDAIARPAWLERIVSHYADRTVGAVGGRDVIWNADRGPEGECQRIGQVRWFGRLYANHHRFTRGVREVAFLKGCDMSFRREVLPRIDPRLVGVIPYGFEVDMGLAVRARGYRVVYDPDAAVDHYPTSDMSAKLASLAYVTNHNQTYILLKRFGWLRRVCFLLYTFLLGDRNTVGLLRVPLLRLREHWSADVIAAHFKGKIQGIRTFSVSLRAKPESDLVPYRADALNMTTTADASSELEPTRGGSFSTSR